MEMLRVDKRILFCRAVQIVSVTALAGLLAVMRNACDINLVSLMLIPAVPLAFSVQWELRYLNQRIAKLHEQLTEYSARSGTIPG